MFSLKQKISEHKAALAVAALCGIIYLTPYLFFILDKRDGFSGIELSNLDAELHYMARVKEVQEGNYLYGNVFLSENRKDPQPVYQYSEQFYGIILKLLHIKVSDFFIAAKFIFAALNFFLWYYFSWLLVKDKKGALLSSSILFFGGEILSNLSIFKQLSILFWHNSGMEMLTYGRFVNPLLTFPFFFLGLIFLYRFYENPNIKNAIVFSLFWGLSFYVYFYFWMFLSIIAALTFVYFLLSKNYKAFKNSIMAGLGALLIAFYYLKNMFLVGYGGKVESATSGALNIFSSSHKPILSFSVLGIFILYLIYLLAKKHRKETMGKGEVFLVLLFLSAITAVNQQVITGRLVEEGHFHWYANKPVIFLTAALLISFFANKIALPKYRNVLYFAIFSYLVFFGIGVQACGYKASLNEYKYYQKYGIFISWLSSNSEKGSVVLANDALSDLIPAYTDNYVYYSPHAIYYSSNPLDRRMEAVDVYAYLDSGDKKNTDSDGLCNMYFEYVYYKYNYEKGNECSAELKDKLNKEYSRFLANGFEKELKKYRLDYIIWDKNKDPNWGIDKTGFAKKIFEKEGVALYGVNDKN